MAIMSTHLKKLLWTIVLAVLFASAAAQAQVYQWKDPESKTTRLSNTAPPWYQKGDSHGPRVQVYYYGALADDTSLAFEVRQGLRSQSPIGRYLPPLLPPGLQEAKR
jgi:hypothetical protein